MTFPILSLMIWLPLLGAVLLYIPQGSPAAAARTARWIALWTSLIVLVLAIVMLIGFNPHIHGFQFNETAAWIPQFHIAYRLGIDGISLFFIVLSALLTPIVILASWRETRRVRDYMAAFLLLETMTIGMFSALDFLMFYIFFEGVLIPMYLIIGVWGGERRIHAAIKFFVFTLAGSLPMLLALVWMWHHAGTTDMITLMHTPIPPHIQDWLFLAFLASFGVKAAVWPLHTWLPDAYGEAPLPGTIMLAAVLSKMGAYGFLRFSLPMLPDAAQYFAPLMFALGIMGVIYISFAALAQTDMKRMIAYSSVAHMGLIVVGIFTFTVIGIEGALFQMVSHGLVIAALFLCVGILLARGHSLRLDQLGGLAVRMPVFASFLMLFVMANVGLPGTSGFVGEILVMVGAIQINFWVAILTGTGMILSVMYMLVMVRRVLFDQARSVANAIITDLTGKEWLMLAPLAVLVIALGFVPSGLTYAFHNAVTDLVHAHVAALQQQATLAMARP
ncbi:MAG: NADH-quinone oxidoreductase subunit M [Acidiphilium sp.]|jgi:NADH dehydrogenase subunit M (EC 1.6.5.3)|uniref:NADH-quinone oxidoreductase subunit M n=1 Tax=Acidiphilium acidophilum TaxID=76588 RepID=A0AAW9DRJ2_ACIAO|nr:NADH-quinone oxidoreductase subunit M [Acidiphilium acidophilum]MDD2860987.1 NADH-quinone oxidoreductase subunit M [Acidiphilium sp.]MDX5930687.1 NADH-quinone oxidoreductase subunit M [Acidiphilium acidophilum]GBR76720.1 NADH-quinone oxidoreductase chain M [Acidiphilium acidophilum DSM 700]